MAASTIAIFGGNGVRDQWSNDLGKQQMSTPPRFARAHHATPDVMAVLVCAWRPPTSLSSAAMA